MKIGIFDSGIGGLSVLREVAKVMPTSEIYYHADRLNAPYGNKSRFEVFNFCKLIVDDFVALGISNILIACNSATAMAIDELRQAYPNIRFFGIEPFINVINFREELKEKKGVVLTTKLTGESKRFNDLKEKYDSNGILDYKVSLSLAKLIEESFDCGRLDEEAMVFEIKTSLKQLDYQFIILGCTHYPFINDIFTRHFNFECISPCVHVANYMAMQINNYEHSEELNYFNYRERLNGGAMQWRKVKKNNLEGFPFF